MQHLIHQIWYQNHWCRWLLWPLSIVFGCVSALRRQLFKSGLKKVSSCPVPLIVVGNITAGGSGKTPTVLYLIELLKRAGYSPGVISRGYGADIDAPIQVTSQHSSEEVGDEPAMIYARTNIPMVVCPDRVAAMDHLLTSNDVDVVICDDGLQHYALARDIELAIIDGERRLGNGLLIPAGPLREGHWRLRTVDFNICNGGDAIEGEVAMSLVLKGLYPVKSSNTHSPPNLGQAVMAMAGIGNPERFFSSLRSMGYDVINTKAFNDHQAYSEQEIAGLDGSLPIVMTEKDAIKCRAFAHANWWYLAVDAKLDEGFDTQLLQRVAAVKAGKQGATDGIR